MHCNPSLHHSQFVATESRRWQPENGAFEQDLLRLISSHVPFSSRAIIAANGSLEREVPLTGKQPTNLAFGGPDGRTVFVTQKEGRFIEAFRVDRPDREPCLQMPRMC
jgi:hypothetical protein